MKLFSRIALTVALALAPVAALAQQAMPPLQNGTQVRPTVTGTDTSAGIYFGPNRTGISGHAETGAGTGDTPTLASCGSGTLTVGSTDTAGTVTLTGVTACTVTFGTPYTAAPHCVLFDQTTNRATLTGVVTATTIPITGATAGDVVSYFCVARSGG